LPRASYAYEQEKKIGDRRKSEVNDSDNNVAVAMRKERVRQLELKKVV